MVSMLGILLFAALFTSPSLGSSSVSSVHTDAHAVVCQSFNIAWAGGTRQPLDVISLRLQNAAFPEPPLESVTQSAQNFVWTPNVPPGTAVLLQVNDSSGALAQTNTFIVQNGSDTSCVVPSLSTSPSASLFISTTASLSPPNPSSSGAANSIPFGSTNNKRVIAAIVVPICVLMLAALIFLFVRLRKSRRAKNPFEDPENIVERDSQPVSLNISPFESPVNVAPPAVNMESQHPREQPEKFLPALPPPQTSQVTSEELQAALDRIQEMYEMMREMQSTSSSNAPTVERVAELQMQIEDLMADNAMLGGEQPPDYDSTRPDNGSVRGSG
ncbi:hypothetical protein GGX14DRAFT_469913 [Mycena pura]|uniref:Mid2 domain-containing protein n=1 Tax=Mycena pura TaxID=153505 RepID=A0AAD6Y633_9AGAR|nr:hypothetical protein GGX14DRAFT_469913 [Mycena pura]